MKDRLQKIIISEGITPAMLADEIGVQRSGISHILSGRNNPSYDFLQKVLVRFPKINAEWLLLGQGSMYKSATQTTVQPNLFDPAPEKVPESPEKESPALRAPEHDKIHQPDLSLDPLPSRSSKKTIEKIVTFYTDKTFKEYWPDNSETTSH